MNRMDDPTMFAQLIRMLDASSLRQHAARVYRAGWTDDLAVIRSEFQRRRQADRPQDLRAA